ncbi:hypothetical protein LCGC14_1053020 [marine sediment metagenome]|uniref:Uncharacterized protein n=1 Tax=marine sediment metagenome TaxID=412755 RepID=A0A0F9MN77_9ZZZZ
MDSQLKTRAIKHLTWMLADIDYRNAGLVERDIGLEKVEDSPDLKDARNLLKELNDGEEKR